MFRPSCKTRSSAPEIEIGEEYGHTRLDRKTLRGAQISHFLQMKTGLGSHLMSLQAFTPKSLTGHIIYCHRMNSVPQIMAKRMVLK